MALKFELLTQAGRSKRGKFFIGQMGQALRRLGWDFIASDYGTLQSDCLILWGVGGPDQQKVYWKYRDAGKAVLMADIGYFGRGKDFRSSGIRISINDYHPQRFLKEQDSSRFDREKIHLFDSYAADGHILLCGLGPKSRWLYNYRGQEWERRALREIQTTFPDVDVVYRHKPKCPEQLGGTLDGNHGDIFQRLAGCRLCVVHHSNVAVDCAVGGVPCVASDGIGAALWPSDIGSVVSRTREERKKFLDSVAWWNWYPHELAEMLEFVEPLIHEDSSRVRETRSA